MCCEMPLLPVRREQLYTIGEHYCWGSDGKTSIKWNPSTLTFMIGWGLPYFVDQMDAHGWSYETYTMAFDAFKAWMDTLYELFRQYPALSGETEESLKLMALNTAVEDFQSFGIV